MAGFEVAIWAEHSEKDEDWVWRALKARVEYIVSGDKEVLQIAQDCGVNVVEIPHGVRGKDLTWDLIHLLRGAQRRHRALTDAIATSKS